jgi:hypothetical protein
MSTHEVWQLARSGSAQALSMVRGPWLSWPASSHVFIHDILITSTGPANHIVFQPCFRCKATGSLCHMVSRHERFSSLLFSPSTRWHVQHHMEWPQQLVIPASALPCSRILGRLPDFLPGLIASTSREARNHLLLLSSSRTLVISSLAASSACTPYDFSHELFRCGFNICSSWELSILCH